MSTREEHAKFAPYRKRMIEDVKESPTYGWKRHTLSSIKHVNRFIRKYMEICEITEWDLPENVMDFLD